MGGLKGGKTPAPVDTHAIAKAEAEKERQKIVERQKRGLEGTIKTSYSGILEPKEMNLVRKKLLGE